MRTTVTLDDDVARAVQELAHRQRTSFKQALNGLVRRGLLEGKPSAARSPFVVSPHRGGFKPGIDPLKLNQLLDSLEVDDFARGAGR